MPRTATTFIFSFIFLINFFINFSLFAQKSNNPARSTPEAEGVSSENIIQFLAAIKKSNIELHSLMMLRHGKVITEIWNSPYRADLKHSLYSCSKSFTSTAIGFAVNENKLSVNDKVISFFPNDLPEVITANLAELKVKDLLTMSVGQDPEPTWTSIEETDWVKSFLSKQIINKPGTKFLYNSLATYMLSAIVQKVTGQKLLDYLTPRLFEPLGIEGEDWETDPKGINTGGWGLRLKTEDLAKFAQFYLQKGNWNGVQLLPAAWIEEATTFKIDNSRPDMPVEQKQASDWAQGYCYQFWRSRNNSFRGDGAYGQDILIFPDQDAVIIITAESPDLQGEMNLVWQYLFPAINAIPSVIGSKVMQDSLKNLIADLSLPLPGKTSNPALIEKISGKTFYCTPNEKFIRNLTFNFTNDICTVALKSDSSDYNLQFGNGSRVAYETKRIGPDLFYKAKAHNSNISAFKVNGNYRWINDSILELNSRYIESPHTETLICTFGTDKITVEARNSQQFGQYNQTFTGIFSPQRPLPTRLIMRGDDMGFSHSGDEALIKSYKEGIETSIEVIVPSPWFEEAVKLLAQNQSIDVGVHLALSSEWENIKWRPLTAATSLRDKDGYFFPMIYPNKNYPNQALSENKWDINDVEKEFRAQIEMALKKIPRISHVSAHMGCTNMTEPLKALAKKLAQTYKIDVDLNALQVENLHFDGPVLTAKDKIQSFINALKKTEPGKTYLFVEHPGFDNPELKAIFHIGYENVASDRQGVTDLFTNENVKDFIRQNGIQLVSYKDLVKEK